MIYAKDLFESRYDKPAFDGETFDATLDGPRLQGQLERVKGLMLDGQWRSLEQIALSCGCTTQGASARLRDLRKARYGSYSVLRERSSSAGVFYYRLISPKT